MNINIFGLKYKVMKTKDIGTSGVANCNYDLKIIKIREDQKGQKYDECLIHEIAHAVFDRIGVGSTKLNPDFEEIICDSLAKVISENYKLVKR